MLWYLCRLIQHQPLPPRRDDDDGLRVRDGRHHQERPCHQPGHAQGGGRGDLPGVAHHSPLDEHSEPGGHHAVDQEVDAGVGEEEQVGDGLRVEDVCRGVVGDVLLHTLDRSVHSRHGNYRQDGSEYYYNINY